jgi:hypothetical protein
MTENIALFTSTSESLHKAGSKFVGNKYKTVSSSIIPKNGIAM